MTISGLICLGIAILAPLFGLFMATDGFRHIGRWPDDPNAGDIGEP